jgi:ADP-ribosylglycohydrolase
MSASVLAHILNVIVFGDKTLSLRDIIIDARDTVCSLFKDKEYVTDLYDVINKAISLADNDNTDLENINCLGEGWVAEETLAIALYCSLRYEHDFSGGIIAAVNHSGDSDSTGAVVGNILGAINGYSQIDDKWKKDLELLDVLLEISDDLCFGCVLSEYDSYRDEDWVRKYVYMHWKENDCIQ